MKKGIIIVAIAIVLVLAAGAVLVFGAYATVGGQRYSVNETALDLSGSDVTELKALARFKHLEQLDISRTAVTELTPLGSCSSLKRVRANGCELTPEEVRSLEETVPGVEVEWDMAVGEARIPAGAETFSGALKEDELKKLLSLEKLKTADLSGSDLCRTLLELPASMPGCTFLWTVPLGNETYPSISTDIAVSGADSTELTDKLRYLPSLATADITACTLSLEETDVLINAYPAVSFTYTVGYGMTTATTDPAFEGMDLGAVSGMLSRLPFARTADVTACALTNEELLGLKESYPDITFKMIVNVGEERFETSAGKVTAPAEVTYDGIVAACALFNDGTVMDLRATSLTETELKTLAEMYPALYIGRTVTVRGKSVYSLAEEADFSGETFADVADAETVMKELPCLKKLILCDCGLTDAQMETLIAAHPDTRFVWTVSLGPHKTLRTDATAFSTFNRSKNISKVDSPELAAIKRATYRLTTEDIQPLKYCTDLVALDLGHNNIDDISVLKNCPHLQWLIIADNFLTDVSVVMDLPELKYVEFFMNDIVDVSPFATCENLLDLNLCMNEIADFSPLYTLKGLERLWYMRNPGVETQEKEIKTALPGCLSNGHSDGSTGSGWREHERYFEMRAIFKSGGADLLE